jgi:hypothetical protein
MKAHNTRTQYIYIRFTLFLALLPFRKALVHVVQLVVAAKRRRGRGRKNARVFLGGEHKHAQKDEEEAETNPTAVSPA